MTLARPRLAQLVLAFAISSTGCAKAARVHSASPTSSEAPARGTSIPPASAPSAATAPAVSAESARPCGEMSCLAFATPQAAFAHVLLRDPRVLAVGEAHAQAGLPHIASSTRRFAEQLLPLLAGRSQHIVIELLVANCKQPTVSGVAKTQAPVTEHQAQSNQAEFLTLGKYAQRLGIEPQALTPSCAEYESVLAAGDDGVARLLSLIAAQTEQSVQALLSKPVPERGAPIILVYGGALHNDLRPRTGQESWSFGPQLSAATNGRYIELDVIVPEFVKDNETWRSLPWFSAFDREHLVSEALLYEPTPNSFTLIFPKTETDAQQAE